ncbi:biotin biosynthesis protein BioY [Thalassobacillus devorans]|uniref:Biotin transporter n=1 Tax=Thalassobacillus devorans TaxID=279813 RepID=A0ABQ1NIN0_9BACI|nr:biotin transporter BioY [Thalassobacillus devorans]NIK27485.1 biotin transport system substrate-specific component [Thalassobacillus devorans]GGC78086.1 biotin biosynthesis protein BioY [Thalassobacillus devorans]
MKLNHLIYVSMFASIMGVLGLLPPIPLGFSPVPITMQTLGVMLAGSVLGAHYGPKYAALSQVLFLLLVMAGAPLLSGGRGGIGVFFTPSAGFLMGWIAGAFVIGYLCQFMKEVTFWKMMMVNLIGGIFIIYFIGVPIQAMIMQISVSEASILSLAFLPGDVLKVTIASFIAVKLYYAAPFKREVRV